MSWRSRGPRTTVWLATVWLLAGAPAVPAAANESSGTPAARAFFAQGDAAAKAGKLADAAAAFRKAIDADPDYVDAHQRLIETTERIESPASRAPSAKGLEALYTRMAGREPKRAAYQWALGFLATDPAKGDAFFRAALALDPSFARAHFMLAKNADLRGDWDAQRAHLAAAVESNPSEPRYLIKYAQAFKRSDPARFLDLASSVVEKFPQSQAAAEALYHLADASSGADRRAYLERLRGSYAADRFGYAATAMYDLYDESATPSEALSIAQEMSKAFPSSKTWARRIELQQTMVRAAALVADRRFADAMELLNAADRPSGIHGGTWALLKAEAAAGAGHTEQAYAGLVETVVAAPDPRVQAALVKSAADIGKTPRDIDADIWRARDAKATPAAAFDLARDGTDATVKLADYRGRVVLIAFWFPG
jgi:tetratricopeptide (TPR) repeat protein